MPMTRIGTCAAMSFAQSKLPTPTRASRTRAQKALNLGLDGMLTLFGVKTRETRDLWTVCSGASSQMKRPFGIFASPLIT